MLHSFWTRVALPAACIGLSLCTVSCTQWRSLQECRGLAERVNSAVDHIEEVQQGTPSPETYETIATQYEQLALALAVTQHTDADLTAAATDYIGVLGKLAGNTRAHAKALKTKSRRKTAATRAAGEKYAKEALAVKRRLERLCRSN